MILGRSGKRLEPRNTLALFKRSLKWLKSELCKPFEGKIIVVTHFAPVKDGVLRNTKVARYPPTSSPI